MYIVDSDQQVIVPLEFCTETRVMRRSATNLVVVTANRCQEIFQMAVTGNLPLPAEHHVLELFRTFFQVECVLDH